MSNLIKELGKPLPQDRVKKFGSNAGAKKGLSYLEGHDVINEMNKVFGYCWSNQVSSMKLMNSREYERNGKKMVEVAYTCIVQVAVEIPGEDGTTYRIQHDGVGGGTSSMPEFNTGEAHEFAAKNAETDALKRACMKLGDRFGLALYEKEQTRVEPAFNHARAQAELLAAVIKEHNIAKGEAIEHIQAGIKKLNDGNLVAFSTFTQEQAEELQKLVLTTTPKELS